MVKEFRMPDLGEGIHEGELLKIFVAQGDFVNEGDPLLEVETDKAAVEIPSPCSGTVEKILVKIGDMVKVGEVLITFRDLSHPEEKKKTGTPSKETEKTSENLKKKTEPETVGAPKSKGRPVPASPSTRRLARELSVDLEKVEPSGPEGLVTAEDVKKFAESRTVSEKQKPENFESENEAVSKARTGEKLYEGPFVPSLPDFSKWGPVKAQPFRSLRRATARQMALAWSQIPHVSNQDVADITRLESFRQKQKARIQKEGGRLTLTVFALKALVRALKAYPVFNSSLDTESGEIILKYYYHVGVAVNSEEGLMVPVIRDADRKSITELSIELFQMAQKARQRKVSIDDLQGGTFTITNAGPMGGGHFSPIINYPEVAILGLGQARMQPVVQKKNGGEQQIVPRLMMPVVLCFDHRVVDGVDAIRFTRMIIDSLEDPDELFLNMV